ncbi:unnamed protein product, partial [Mesorhabditis belari]|uniref:Importin N-terminal domain-containing protein n=1 Tax=Mesorhabditis belari TaxID=2138241 RepID=A0AAF3J5P1_9BILA
MNREQLLHALQATTSSTESKEAGNYLDGCTRVIGFPSELLKVVVDGSVPDTVRQAAVIYFKNTLLKHWEKDEEDTEKENNDFCIADQDKFFIRENIVDAVCVAPEMARIHLCTAVQTIVRLDYPDKWPNLVAKITQLLSATDANQWLGAFLVIYKVSKVYEYRRAKERGPLVEAMQHILPIVYQHFIHLLPNPSQESVLLQKIILKIFFALIQFSLNMDMLPVEVLDQWLEAIKEIVVRPVPAEAATVDDKDEAAQMIWWKAKKWACKILERVFDRYGAPGQVDKGYAEFANHFIAKFSIPCVEAFLSLLEQKRQGHLVTDRVLHLSISFLNTAVSHSVTWKVIKPHMLDVVKLVLFPLMCHSDEDEELWVDDVQEYIRFKFDIFEDLHNPTYAAGSLLTAISKRKDTMQPLLQFIIQALTDSHDARQVDGALHMVGELANQLCKSKKYKKDVEKLLEAHVTGRLLAQERFVRARAAWCVKAFSNATFHHKNYLSKIVQNIAQVIAQDNEELPVKVEAALALQYLLNDQGETVQTMLRPMIKDIIPKVLELVAKTQIEDVCGVMDQLIEDYMDEVIPIATKLSETLSNMFIEIITQEEIADDRTPTLMSVISTLTNILDVVEEHADIMRQVEQHVLRIIKLVFESEMADYYDDILLLIQSLINSYVSVDMWAIYFEVYKIFKSGNNSLVLFTDIMPVLHQYLATDTDGFLARPERLACCYEMCELVLRDKDQGDDNQVHAAKMLECLLLQCPGVINSALPQIIVLTLQRLSEPFEGLTELKPLLVVVLIAAVYTNAEMAIQTLRQVAPHHPNPLDYLTEELISLTTKWEGIHNRKMVIFCWCTLLRLPAQLRPTIISYQPVKVIESCVTVFEGLERSMKAQAEGAKLEDEDSEEDSDDDEENLPKKGKKKGSSARNKHRNMDQDLGDSEDEIDEGTLQYLQSLAKQHKTGEDGEDDEDSGDDSDGEEFELDETESEAFVTPLDDEETAPDPFVMFKKTMEEFERVEPALFNQMVSPLDEKGQEALRKLITTCAQHAQHEESKKVEQAGGYEFGKTEVPTAFNFIN